MRETGNSVLDSQRGVGMAYNIKLAERIRAVVKGLPIIEKKMFGGVGYTLPPK